MQNKVVIITGGSSGIGLALAREFGKHGSQVFITGRNAIDLYHVVDVLQKENMTVFGYAADVSIADDNQKMVDEVLRRFGRIDILINNAGISMNALFEEVDMKVIKKVMDINFFGVLYATQACLPEIIKNKGSVVGISSIAGYRGLPARAGYSASKFALNGFLEVLRTEMLYRHVHVLTACPGFTTSNIRKRALSNDGLPQNKSPRNEQQMMSAEECAHHIYRAVVNRKNNLILTTQGKVAVWMNYFFPRLADWLTYRVMAKENVDP